MNVKQAYESIGADYADVLRRLMSDSLVERFAGKFLEDDSFAKLKDGIAAGDAEAAFMASHTLKGVSQNLGLTNLYGPAHDICEELRGGQMGRAAEMFVAVEEQYNKTVEALQG